MPRLDPFIQRMFSDRASELVLASGAGAGLGAVLATARGQVALLQQPITAPQIRAVLAEIAPQDVRTDLALPGDLVFAYRAPAGAVEVRVENGEEVRVVVTPAAAPQPLGTAPSVALPPPGPAPVAAPAAPEPEPEPPSGAAAPVASPSDPRAAMDALLDAMVARRASDLHLSSEVPPIFRVDGDMVPVESYGPVPAERLRRLLWSITPERFRKEWEERKDTDFAHETGAARFRVNVFTDRKGIGAVFRKIPVDIPTADAMGLSQPVLDLCTLNKGLVLVTGPTGSGKSTTLAAMIDHVNRTRDDHIITIEDPVEFVHQNRRCLVNQREVNVHTGSFKAALRAALREDPDVILVGELRDLETIAIAIETAETGHLVFGTLHTSTAASTVDRIIDQFPADRQAQIRLMLSESLKGVIAQMLCKKVGGGRVAAREVLLCSSAVSNLIREGKTFQIASIMQTGRNQGMVTLNDALLELVKKGQIEPREACAKAVAKPELRTLLERNGFDPDGGPGLDPKARIA